LKIEKKGSWSGKNFCMVIEGPFEISNFPFWFFTIFFFVLIETQLGARVWKDEGHGFKNRAQIEFPLKTV